jgi:menaquinone-dependent protoporphyrinogen oxidase
LNLNFHKNCWLEMKEGNGMDAQPNRRQFLKTGCIAAAAIGVTLCGGAAFAGSYQPKIETPFASYGDPKQGKRVLVAYATKAGSTADAAVRIGQVLARQGAVVDVLPLKQVTSLAAYHAVILGSAIRMGKLLPETQAFVEKNQSALRQLPFSVYILCMTLQTDTPETRQTVSSYLDPVHSLVKPVSEGLFAGAIIPAKLALIDRLIVKMLKVPEGDFRKWDQIEAWAEGLGLA